MVSFRESLRGLLYFSRLCGLAPLTINFKGNREITSSRCGVIYSIVIAITYGSFHVTSSIFNLDAKADNNIVTIVINYYNRYSRLVLLWICIANAIGNKGKIIQALRLIECTEKLFARELGYRASNIKFARIVILEILLYLASIFALEWNNCLMFITGIDVFNNYCMSMCLIPLIVANADQILFINLLYLIKERLVIINEFLSEKIQLKKTMKMKENLKINGHILKTINLLYNIEHEMHCAKIKMVQSRNSRGYIECLSLGFSKLHEASQFINSAYGIPNLCTIFIRFVTLTTLAYSSCMRMLKLEDHEEPEHHFQHGAVSKVPAIIGWILMNFTEMIFLCYVCHAMKEEAKYIGYNLQYYRVENSHHDDVEASIDNFSHQLLHQRIEICPCGFFVIDLTFLLALIVTVTTYLMILIQFDISQKSQNN